MDRVTVSEAAGRLGVTPDAVRMRIRRGTIQHEKDENGRTYVYLNPSEPPRNAVPNVSTNAYIETLKSHNDLLRHELEAWQEEARRKDTIIAQMNQTIAALAERLPELEAGSPRAERGSPVTASEERGNGDGSQGYPRQEKRSWWQRVFGG